MFHIRSGQLLLKSNLTTANRQEPVFFNSIQVIFQFKFIIDHDKLKSSFLPENPLNHRNMRAKYCQPSGSTSIAIIQDSSMQDKP